MTDKLDTGTGGFPLGDNNALHTYDTGAENVSSDGSNGTWNPGNVDASKATQGSADLTPGNKKTLADYLSNQTKVNRYPVEFEPTATGDFSLETPDGLPTQITPTKNMHKFVETVGVSPKSTLSTTSEAYRQSNLGAYLYKGKSTKLSPNPGDARDGNTLLNSVELVPGTVTKNLPPDPYAKSSLTSGASFDTIGQTSEQITRIKDGHPVQRYSTALLNNRFSIDKQYESQSNTNSFFADQFADKYPMGKSLSAEDPRNLSYGKLAQVGVALSLRSGLETTDIANSSGAVSEAEALLPGAAQLAATRIERGRLEARTILDDMLSAGLEDVNPTNVVINPAALSWGSMNNVFEQYSGISNFGMQVLSITLIIAMYTVVAAAWALFQIPSGQKEKMIYVDKIGRRTLGAYIGNKSGQDLGSVAGIIKAAVSGNFNLWTMLGIYPTSRSLEDCVFFGALTFFGIEWSELDTKSGKDVASAKRIVLNSLSAGAQNPGFDVVVNRAMIRSFLTISDSFNSFKGTTAVGGVKKVIGLIDVLKDAKFMRLLNIFAQLGDSALSQADYYVDKNTLGAAGRKYSTIDVLENDQKSSQTKIRLKESTKLAYASYRAPDMIIMPVGYRNALSLGKLDEPAAFPYIKDATSVVGKVESSLKNDKGTFVDTRISTAMREALEEKLESEHMPFYFHDLRTNEIISFHAFLTSLTDDYTASYESMDAYGRVEPVKIYKNTHRKLSFSFYVAALDHQDFDSMWRKINKLITLVYPQYTEGKLLSYQKDNSNYQISMPFSQMIGASPMIRLRIGDLIKSNYSKFNLARVFGYTYPNNQLSGSVADSSYEKNISQDPARKSTVKDAAMATDNFFEGIADISKTNAQKRAAAGEFQNLYWKYTGPPTTIYRQIKTKQEAKMLSPGENGYNLQTGDSLHIAYTNEFDTDSFVFQINWERSTAPGENLSPEFVTVNPVISPELKDKEKIALLKANSALLQGQVEAAVDPRLLVPTEESRNLVYNKYKPLDKGDYYEAAADLMSSEANKGNIVEKSFRTVGGKGLAGFIETIHFDWYDKVTWAGFGVDTGIARKAPKLCKVTINFSPVHDISPGIDHVGSNRAPIYPIGYLAPRKKGL